jgi:hypothetical protein
MYLAIIVPDMNCSSTFYLKPIGKPIIFPDPFLEEAEQLQEQII